MKRVMIFCWLKVKEGWGYLFGFVLGSMLYSFYIRPTVQPWVNDLSGYALLLVLAVVFLILYLMCRGLTGHLKANWRKAGELAGKGGGMKSLRVLVLLCALGFCVGLAILIQALAIPGDCQHHPVLVLYEMDEHYRFIPVLQVNLELSKKLPEFWEHEIVFRKDKTYKFEVGY